MPTPRKYNLARVDTCLRFNRNETGKLFYLRFDGQTDIDKRLADVPCRGGCYNNDVFPVDENFEKLADKWERWSRRAPNGYRISALSTAASSKLAVRWHPVIEIKTETSKRPKPFCFNRLAENDIKACRGQPCTPQLSVIPSCGSIQDLALK